MWARCDEIIAQCETCHEMWRATVVENGGLATIVLPNDSALAMSGGNRSVWHDAILHSSVSYADAETNASRVPRLYRWPCGRLRFFAMNSAPFRVVRVVFDGPEWTDPGMAG